jgi:hypothetical protein
MPTGVSSRGSRRSGRAIAQSRPLYVLLPALLYELTETVGPEVTADRLRCQMTDDR